MFKSSFNTPKKKVIKKTDGKRLLLDFVKKRIEIPKRKDIVIEQEPKKVLKEETVVPTIKKKPPKKGKSLF